MDYLRKYSKYKIKYSDSHENYHINNSDDHKHKQKQNYHNVNFENLKIITKIKSCKLGTTYLVRYKEKEYIFKDYYISKKEKKSKIWNEFRLYDYLKTLNKHDRNFFQMLHAYNIYNEDSFVHYAPQQCILTNNFENFINQSDESKLFVKYLLSYRGNITLDQFLQKSELCPTFIYSLCLQICKIIYILHKGGYSHDLHPKNILINETNKKYFHFMEKKIPNNGYQLTVINYGEIVHKTFNINYYKRKRDAEKDKERFFFNELFYNTFHILDGCFKNVYDCKKYNKTLPWDRKEDVYDIATRLMIKNHRTFYDNIKYKYIKQFPDGKYLLDHVVRNLKYKITIVNMINTKKYNEDFWEIMHRIIYDFKACFPDKHAEYWKWYTYYECIVPIQVMQKLLVINNSTDYIDYLLSLVETY